MTPKNIYGIAVNFGDAMADKDKVQLWFDKPASSVIFDNEEFRLPANMKDVIHEVELGVVIGKPGRDIAAKDALSHIQAYFITIDFTNKEKLLKFKPDGAPWCLIKGSDGFCAVSDFIDVAEVEDPHNLNMKLTLNGELKQDFNTSGLRHKIPDQIAFLSHHVALKEGDLILTGTGGGVSPVKAGDHIETFMYQNEKELLSMRTPVVAQV